MRKRKRIEYNQNRMVTTILLLLISGTAVVASSKNASDEHNKDDQKLASFQEISESQTQHLFTAGECTSATKGTFTPYDYAVVIAMLAVSLKIGVFYRFCHKRPLESSSDFMLGSQMGLFPVTLSLTTSFVTAIELLGNPSEMFFFGSQYALIGKLFSFFLFIKIASNVSKNN
jgi:solute carrier family 5 (sodium-coupled monocarboxylate transporter), member 8/12